MYNEKIEALIKAALADGVLTEKEKQILFKRAQEEGVDLDEFEMVLDAREIEAKNNRNVKKEINFDRIREIEKSLRVAYEKTQIKQQVTLFPGKTKAAIKANMELITKEDKRIIENGVNFVLSLSLKANDTEYNLAVINFIHSFFSLDFSEENLKDIIEGIQEGYISKNDFTMLSNLKGRKYAEHFYFLCQEFEKGITDSQILKELPLEYKQMADWINKFNLFVNKVKGIKRSLLCAKIAYWSFAILGTCAGWWEWWIIFILIFVGLSGFYIAKKLVFYINKSEIFK